MGRLDGRTTIRAGHRFVSFFYRMYIYNLVCERNYLRNKTVLSQFGSRTRFNFENSTESYQCFIRKFHPWGSSQTRISSKFRSFFSFDRQKYSRFPSFFRFPPVFRIRFALKMSREKTTRTEDARSCGKYVSTVGAILTGKKRYKKRCFFFKKNFVKSTLVLKSSGD